MNRDHAIDVLRAHESELRASGIASLALFGSTARNEVPANDVDLAVRFADDTSCRGFGFIERLERLEHRLSEILGCAVDVVEEPVRHQRLQQEIDKDRAVAF